MILVGQHLVFSGQFIPANDEVCFSDQIQFSQQILDPLRPFDFDRAHRMIQLYMHGRMISDRTNEGQGEIVLEGTPMCEKIRLVGRGKLVFYKTEAFL